MKAPSSTVALTIAVTLLLLAPSMALAVSASSVTLNFMCPCGSCDEALSTCECPSSDSYRAQIASMVGGGYSEQQIIDEFRGRFGPQVLIANAAMAPGYSEKGGMDKGKIGFFLLLASFTLAAFALGRFMSAAPSPASGRGRAGGGKRTGKGTGRKSRRTEGRKRVPRGEVDDELLDD